MRAPARPRRVVLEARAKLNLGLAVGPMRADGYHDIASVFQSVSLADTLIAERTARGYSLRIEHEFVALKGAAPARGRAHVPAGTDNLVLRAARHACERLALPGGVRFRLIKRIPSRAGLGGGSADAAAAILACARLHGLRLPRARRIALALGIGSDVPFAITGGTAIVTGRGEKLSRSRLAEPFRALVAVPRWRVSTPEAFARIDRGKYALTAWGRSLRFAGSLRRKRLRIEDALRLGNVFEKVLQHRRPEFESLCRRIRAAGLLAPRMTGSGSGVFGVVPRGHSVREAAAKFSGPELLFAVRSVGTGLQSRTQR